VLALARDTKNEPEQSRCRAGSFPGFGKLLQNNARFSEKMHE